MKRKPTDEDPESTPVNGTRLAVSILNRFDTGHRERILRAIEGKDPKTFSKLQRDIFLFDDLISLTDQGMQLVISQIDYSELLVALSGSKPELLEAVLKNVSARKRGVLLEDLKSLPPKSKDVIEAAQRKIVALVEKLRLAGAVKTQSEDDIWV